jgi:hypothetical protein
MCGGAILSHRRSIDAAMSHGPNPGDMGHPAGSLTVYAERLSGRGAVNARRHQGVAAWYVHDFRAISRDEKWLSVC